MRRKSSWDKANEFAWRSVRRGNGPQEEFELKRDWARFGYQQGYLAAVRATRRQLGKINE